MGWEELQMTSSVSRRISKFYIYFSISIDLASSSRAVWILLPTQEGAPLGSWLSPWQVMVNTCSCWPALIPRPENQSTEKLGPGLFLPFPLSVPNPKAGIGPWLRIDHLPECLASEGHLLRLQKMEQSKWLTKQRERQTWVGLRKCKGDIWNFQKSFEKK